MLEIFSPQILVALLTALLTAAVTLISVYLANMGQQKTEEAKFERNKEAEHAAFKRKKLEELYLLFSKWDADLAALGYLFIHVIEGKVSEEEVLQSASKNQLSEKDYLLRIQMMVDLYFPNLKNEFDLVLDAREGVWQFVSDKFSSKVRVENLIEVQENFRTKGKEFKKKISEIANTI